MGHIRCITGEPIPGDQEERKNVLGIITRLVEENDWLKHEVEVLEQWPAHIPEDERKTLIGWQKRAVLAEKRLEAAYQTIRELNAKMREEVKPC